MYLAEARRSGACPVPVTFTVPLSVTRAKCSGPAKEPKLTVTVRRSCAAKVSRPHDTSKTFTQPKPLVTPRNRSPAGTLVSNTASDTGSSLVLRMVTGRLPV